MLFGRDATILLWLTFAKGLQIALFGLLFNLYLYAAGYDRQFIGLVNAIPALTSLLCSFPSGLLADRIGYKPLLLVTGFGTPIVLLALALTQAAVPLLLLAVAFGAITTLYWVSCVPLLAAKVPAERRVQLFAVNSFLLYGAGSFGYLLGGQIVAIAAGVLHQSSRSLLPLRWGMLAMVVVTLLGALPLPWIRSAPRQPEATRARPTYDLGLYARLLGPDMLLTFGGGAVFGFVGLYMTLRFGMRPADLGLFLTISGVIGGCLILLAPTLARVLGTTRAAILLQGAGAPAVLLLALAPVQWLAMGGEVLRNACRSIGDPVYTAFIVSRVPEQQRATISGLYSTTWSIGFSLGPAASGVVQQHFGFTPAFLLGAGCIALGATLLWHFAKRMPGAMAPRQNDVPERVPAAT
jgi:MFS family permease